MTAYSILKNKLDIVWNDVHFNRVLAAEIWGFASPNCYYSWKRIFLMFLILNTNKFKTCSINQPIFATYGTKFRKDYREIYDNVIKKYGTFIISNSFPERRFKLSIHPQVICYFLIQVFVRLKSTHHTFFQKLIICSHFVHYANLYISISKIDIANVKKYVCFCDIHTEDNLMTQYFKNKNIPTYSMQHGLYKCLKDITSINIIPFENQEADILLCWGEYSIS